MAERRKIVRLKYKKERVLLSDVLPYELPFIISNRYFYRFLIRNKIEIRGNKIYWDNSMPEGAKLILALIFQTNASNLSNGELDIGKLHFKTIPFTYNILHKPTKHRQLSIIHPANQIKVVDFYDQYKNLIPYLCSKSRFSLRHPEKVACYFYYKDRLHKKLLGGKEDKIEMFYSEYENLKTFFSYKKYTHIYKFYESYMYQKAEKRFQYLLKFDLQSCFDSIYTHSVSWAISGGVDIYKDKFNGKPDESFGEKWDKMMQEMNYNETNGIVIGPEFSRIFAEVILQHIDMRVENVLERNHFKVNVDYECHRYLDDYFFFYNSEEVKKIALEEFQKTLKEFKLTISNEKTGIFNRPFITEITKAKIAVVNLINDMLIINDKENSGSKINEENEDDDQELSDVNESNKEEQVIEKISKEELARCLSTDFLYKYHSTNFCRNFKRIISDNAVEPKDISNYTLHLINNHIVRIIKKFDKVYKTLRKAAYNHISDECCRDNVIKKVGGMERLLSVFLYEIIDSTFFIYSLNKRVTTTLRVLQILDTIITYLDNTIDIGNNSKVTLFSEYFREIIFKKIRDEIKLVLQTAPFDENIQVETMYFLVLLRKLNKKYQFNADFIRKYLKKELDDDGNIKKLPSFNAISIIILLYYFGNRPEFEELKNQLIEKTIEKYDSIPETRRKSSSEYIILALDIAACPYVHKNKKLEFLQKVGISENDGKKVLEYMKHQKYMFTKWTGVNITKELNAKISLEVYA